MVETPFERYRNLVARRPDLFEGRDPGGYQILPPASLESGVEYSDEYALLLRDHVRFPDGHEGNYIRIISPPHGATGAAILPIVDGKILLLNQYRHATGKRHIEIPRGFSDVSESSIEAARRELQEETGLRGGEFYSLGLIHPDSGLLQTVVEIFLFRNATDPGLLKTEKGVELLLIEPDEAIQFILSEKITDSFTIAAVLKAHAARLLYLE